MSGSPFALAHAAARRRLALTMNRPPSPATEKTLDLAASGLALVVGPLRWGRTPPPSTIAVTLSLLRDLGIVVTRHELVEFAQRMTKETT